MRRCLRLSRIDIDETIGLRGDDDWPGFVALIGVLLLFKLIVFMYSFVYSFSVI